MTGRRAHVRKTEVSSCHLLNAETSAEQQQWRPMRQREEARSLMCVAFHSFNAQTTINTSVRMEARHSSHNVLEMARLSAEKDKHACQSKIIVNHVFLLSLYMHQ